MGRVLSNLPQCQGNTPHTKPHPWYYVQNNESGADSEQLKR